MMTPFCCRCLAAVVVLALLAWPSAEAARAQDELLADGSTGEVQLGPPLDLPPDGASLPGPPLDMGVPLYEHDLSYVGWGLHLLPEGLIYRSYLAGPKESRMGMTVVRIPDDSWLWDATIGGRLGILRFGTSDPIRPRGFQMDVEASAQVRLDLLENVDVRATDYRVGVPLTWGNERRQWKFAYYHMSSHLADEFFLKNPDFPFFFQARDALVLGRSLYLTDALRLYGEAAWAFYSNASEPWEFQFGIDFAPRVPTGLHGAPFFAINGHLRQELDYGGGVTVQLGWAWRSDMSPHLLRTGFQYYNGASTEYAFLPFHEQQLAFGLWYDF